MRSVLGLVASGLAGLAAIVASLDGHGDFVPFFVILTFAGGLVAWAAHPPFDGARRRVSQAVALGWLGVAVWVAVLLVMSVTVWQGSSPPPTPEGSYLGVPATGYYVAGLYAGAALVSLLAFGRPGWFGGRFAASATDAR